MSQLGHLWVRWILGIAVTAGVLTAAERSACAQTASEALTILKDDIQVGKTTKLKEVAQNIALNIESLAISKFELVGNTATVDVSINALSALPNDVRQKLEEEVKKAVEEALVQGGAIGLNQMLNVTAHVVLPMPPPVPTPLPMPVPATIPMPTPTLVPPMTEVKPAETARPRQAPTEAPTLFPAQINPHPQAGTTMLAPGYLGDTTSASGNLSASSCGGCRSYCEPLASSCCGTRWLNRYRIRGCVTSYSCSSFGSVSYTSNRAGGLTFVAPEVADIVARVDAIPVGSDTSAWVAVSRASTVIVPSTTREIVSATHAYGQGYHAFWKGDYQLAADRFAAAIAADEKDARYWYFKGLSELSLGLRDTALESLAMGVELESRGLPGRSEICHSLERLQGPQRRMLTQAVLQVRTQKLKKKTDPKPSNAVGDDRLAQSHSTP